MATIESKFTSLHTIHVPDSGPNHGVIRLIPGVNTIPDSDWEAAEKNPQVQRLIKAGLLKPAEKSIKSLASMSIEDAKALIEKCAHGATLDMWAQSETRAGVREAIDAQRKAIDPRQTKDAK